MLLKRGRTNLSKKSSLPRNIRDAFEESKTVKPELIPLFWDLLKEEYEPTLKIHSYRLITQPRKIIDCNLRLRISGLMKSNSVTSSTDFTGDCQKHV